MSKWLEFKQQQIPPERKTKVVRVEHKDGTHLGDIKWDCGWRQYVFDDGYLKLSLDCMEDICSQVRALKQKREQKQ